MQGTKKYDVAFSFAGEDREFVGQVADILLNRNARVFYDEFEQIALWGENLPEKLDQIYRLDSRYVVVFISEAYASKMWTRFEIRSVLSTAINSSTAYLLPARLMTPTYSEFTQLSHTLICVMRSPPALRKRYLQN